MNYQTLKESTKLDHNSCTVIASSLAFNQPYNEMLKHYDKQGRKRGRGVTPTTTKRINMDLALKFDYEASYTKRENVRTWTIRKHGKAGATMTVGNCHKYLRADRNYILGVRGHSLAMVNGTIEDHTAGRKNRIISILELKPPGSQEVEVLDSRKLLNQEILEAEAMIKLLLGE